MKSYSVDLREKIVAAHIEKNISIRKVANIFSVSKSLVQKLVKQKNLMEIYNPSREENHNLVI